MGAAIIKVKAALFSSGCATHIRRPLPSTWSVRTAGDRCITHRHQPRASNSDSLTVHASQDLDYDAAVPLYVNRRFFVEFLHMRVFQKGHKIKNILEDFIYVTFRSTQYVAMVRANALVDILISRPMRWLSGKSSQLVNWSPRSMGEVLDIVEQFFVQAQYDGTACF